MTPWSHYIDAWMTYQQAAGTPATTLLLRRNHLRYAARELGGEPGTVTGEQLLQWTASKGWQPATRRSYRQTLRSFYSWAVRTGRLEASPAEQLPPVKVPRRSPRPASEDAFRAALAAADPQLQAAILLAGVCGLRRSEVARVRREHVERDLLGWALRVAGKGGHVRMVPLPDELAALVLAAPLGWLFPSPARPGRPLTPEHLGKLVSDVLPAGVTMHALRHRCGFVSYDGTKDIRAVQELLGHANLDTTMLYTYVPPASIRAAMVAAA